MRTGAMRQHGVAVRNAPRDGFDARVGDASRTSTDVMDVMEVATMDPMRQIVTKDVPKYVVAGTCHMIEN